MTQLVAAAETVNGLTYPYGKSVFPDAGQSFEIAPGVHWLHMPLPYSLNRINLWLLEDGDGWTVVDTGLDTPESKAIWEKAFTGIMQGKPIKRVVVT
ncbi:MAG: MBL fold metallo-hydrolase, partial [Nevskiales bacterium]